MTPRFSCVIPVKGERPFFERAMESLRNQGMGDKLEIIVQDAEVESDQGQSDALNRGFAKAHGEWLFWLNADDVLLPGALKKVEQKINERGTRTNWIAGNEYFIDSNDRRVGCSVGCGWHDWLFKGAVPHVNGPSAFFRRELLESVGGFDVSLKFCMDWDLWLRFMQAGARFVRINDFLWAQRRWEGSKTQRELSNEENSLHQAEVQRMLQKNHFAVTRSGVRKMHIWKALNGNYLKELFLRLQEDESKQRAAIMVMHRAPYRDPVLDALKKTSPVDVFAIYENDFGHDWAGFGHDMPVLAGRGIVFRLLWRFVFSKKYSLVVWPAYHPWWLTVPILFSAIIGRRYAMTSDTKVENGGGLSRSIKRYLYRHAEFIWVPGKAARRFQVEKYQVREDRIVEGLFLVDPKAVTIDPKERGSERRNFLMVANDVPWRRIDALVEGFRRARKDGETLTLCGAGCSKYAGDGVVGMEGVAWNDLMKLYDANDVYVHNGMEQYSTAVQIAALRGMPIICSSAVGIVADFENAARDMIVVQEWDSAEAWADAFERMKKMSAADLRLMCEKVRNDSAKLYQVERVVNEVHKKVVGA